MDGFFSALDPVLTVVTAADGDEHDGCLVGFGSQCSIEPLRMFVCLSTLNRTYAIAQRATALAVHVLGTAQRDAASLFGECSGDDTDKLARVPWHTGSAGAPILDECAEWLEGVIERRVVLGDHVGHVLAPVAAGSGSHHGALRLRDVRGLTAGHPPKEVHGRDLGL